MGIVSWLHAEAAGFKAVVIFRCSMLVSCGCGTNPWPWRLPLLYLLRLDRRYQQGGIMDQFGLDEITQAPHDVSMPERCLHRIRN